MEHLQYLAQAKYMAFHHTESMAVFLMMPVKWVHKQSSESDEERLEKWCKDLAKSGFP